MIILYHAGSCLAAGYSDHCCVNGSCLGSPPNCHCDANCYLFEDCCTDVPLDCNKLGKYSYHNNIYKQGPGLASLTP